jgi:AraC family transcriptional regulator
MTTTEPVLTIDYARAEATASILPRPPLLSSQGAGWKHIQLAHYLQPAWELPKFVANQHAIVMANWKKSTAATLVADGREHRLVCKEDRSGLVEILPADTVIAARWTQEVEFTHIYLEPSFISQIAYESVDPDLVELTLSLQQFSPLLWNIVQALRSSLQTEGDRSALYADSMAVAIAVHLLTHYTTHTHAFKECDALSRAKLDRTIEYINSDLNRDLSISDIAANVGLSQYHFSRLFKQSMGITVRKYVITQRVNRAKQLLIQTKMTILEIANDCGFANPSHLTRTFRQQLGITPTQFRSL